MCRLEVDVNTRLGQMPQLLPPLPQNDTTYQKEKNPPKIPITEYK